MTFLSTQNKRVYYAVQAVGFAVTGQTFMSTGRFRAAKGVQSINITTSYNLEQAFELGQLEIYENIENVPNVEFSVSKVIDGYSLLEHLATPTAVSNTLAGRYNDQKCDVLVSYYNLTLDYASGTPLSATLMKDMYVSSLSWTIPVEGFITETITLVGNDKSINTAVSGSMWITGTLFASGNESPITNSGGIQRRENVIMASSFWPLSIPGISGIAGSGKNITLADGSLGAHIQNVTISTDLGRTELFELGRKGTYYRYPNFPTAVNCSIEVTASEYGDNVSASGEADNLVDEKILIWLQQGVKIDLGTKNKLATVTTQGGDATGGNVTISYNYQNFNGYAVSMPHTDPAGLA